MITTKLTNTRRRIDRMQIPPAAIIAVLVFVVAGAISAIGRYTAPQATPQPTPALMQAPVIVILRATEQPTAAPTLAPTPDERVYQELQALREQMAQLQAAQAAAPAPQPEVVYIASQAEQAAPTPAPATEAPVLRQLVVLDRGAWAAAAATARAGK